MTEYDKRNMVGAMTGMTDMSLVEAYLKIAARKILNRLFPYDPYQTEVPDRFATNQVEIAVFLINKRGAEGESSHTENGISRTYGGADVPAALLRDIIPFASTILVEDDVI